MRRSPLVTLLVGALVGSVLAAVSEPAAAYPIDPYTDPGYGLITGSVSVQPGINTSIDVDVSVQRVGSSVVRVTDSRDYAYEARVAAGDYYVWFTPEDPWHSWQYYGGGRSKATAKIVRVGDRQRVTGVDAVLKPDAGTIVGEVEFPTPRSSRDSLSTVTAYHLDGGQWVPVPARVATATTRPDFILENLPAGEYRLKYERNNDNTDTSSGFLGGADDAASSTPVKVTTRGRTEVTIAPRPSATITGRVVDPEGNPMAGVEVTAMYRERRDPTAWDYDFYPPTTDAAGRYTIDRLDVVDHVLQFAPPAGYEAVFSGDVLRDYSEPYNIPSAPDDAETVRTVAGGTVDVGDLKLRRLGTLRGTVVDYRSGRGVPGVKVVARQVGRVSVHGVEVGEEVVVVTDAQGRYSFGPKGQGPYLLDFRDTWHDDRNYSYEGEVLNPEIQPSFTDVARVVPEQTTVADGQVEGFAPSLSDTTPVVGQTLSALPKGATSAPEGIEWRWRRNGKVVPDASSSSYVVSTADLGKKLSADVTLRTRGLTVRDATASSAKVTLGKPQLTLAASSTAAGRVVLTVKGAVGGLPTSTVDGTVEVVHLNTGRRTTASMVDGALTVTLTSQPKGIQTYSARFLAQPDRFAASALAQRSVTVR